MDVEDNLCWRCEVPLHTSVICRHCVVAAYCSDTCMEADEKTHFVRECQMISPRSCNQCQEKDKTFLTCSGCYDSWYCDRKCQRKHWKEHKERCTALKSMCHLKANQLRMAFKMASYKRSFKNMSNDRGVETTSLPFALDLLKLPNNELKCQDINIDELKVLSLAENFLPTFLFTGFSVPDEFTNMVTFSHVAFDTITTARDVCLLYIMITRDEPPNPVSDIIPRLWFSFRLTSEIASYLQSTLRKLTALDFPSFTKKVKGKMNLKSDDFAAIQEVWRRWSGVVVQIEASDCIPLEQRRKMELRTSEHLKGIEEYREFLPELHIPSIDQWFADGNFVLPSEHNQDVLTHYNVLFLEDLRPSATSNPSQVNFHLRYDGIPFKIFDYNIMRKAFADTPISAVELVYRFTSKLTVRLVKLFDNDQIKADIHLFNDNNSYSLKKIFGDAKFDRMFFPASIVDAFGISFLLDDNGDFLNDGNPCSTLITESTRWLAMEGIEEDHAPELIEDLHFDSCKYSTYLKKSYILSLEPRTAEFISYLRADMLAYQQSGGLDPTKEPPKMAEIINRNASLSLREFQKKKNRVVPFMYRVPCRSMNNISGRSRFLEWIRPNVKEC